MTPTYKLSVLAVIAVLGISTAGLAADYGSTTGSPNANANPATSPASSVKSSDMSSLTGTVQMVDAANKSIQIQDATGALQMLKVSKTTEISRQGQTVQLAELKKGDSVTITNANSAANLQ